MLGLPGRDGQIAHMQATIRNLGRAGIPTLGYHWVPNGVWRTPDPAVLTGGARGTRFDLAAHEDAGFTHGREFTADEMWENYQYYLERILPVAEEAGVRLALHPDDPPVPSLGGIARIFGSFDAFRRAMDRFDSPNHGLNFCMGCWSEMGGHDNVRQGHPPLRRPGGRSSTSTSATCRGRSPASTSASSATATSTPSRW